MNDNLPREALLDAAMLQIVGCFPAAPFVGNTNELKRVLEIYTGMIRLKLFREILSIKIQPEMTLPDYCAIIRAEAKKPQHAL